MKEPVTRDNYVEGRSKPLRILHILCQRPGFTGSGTFLKSLVDEAASESVTQGVIVGVPSGSSDIDELNVDESLVFPVWFETEGLPFSVAGMSDAMPYKSTRFSTFNDTMLDQYLRSFRSSMVRALELLSPTVIWSHHVWITSSLARRAFPGTPLMVFAHSTELRQAVLAPSLVPYVLGGCGGFDRVYALSAAQGNELVDRLSIPRDKILVTGGAIRTDLFCLPHDARKDTQCINVVYVGKMNFSKGVMHLLDAFEGVQDPLSLTSQLLLVGGGDGDEVEAIYRRAACLGERVKVLGVLHQTEVATVLKRAHVLVLPSFFEGLALVVLEALASGCRIVTTENENMRQFLPRQLLQSGFVRVVTMPRMHGPDTPEPADLPIFVSALRDAIQQQIDSLVSDTDDVRRHVSQLAQQWSWSSLYHRVKEDALMFLAESK